MRYLFLAALIIGQHNFVATAETTSVDTQKEAIDIVAAISENLASLIIHHKKTSDPEITKQHSVELVKSITQAIALCISNAKNKHTTKNIAFYDQATLDAMIGQITQKITQLVQADEIG